MKAAIAIILILIFGYILTGQCEIFIENGLEYLYELNPGYLNIVGIFLIIVLILNLKKKCENNSDGLKKHIAADLKVFGISLLIACIAISVIIGLAYSKLFL